MDTNYYFYSKKRKGYLFTCNEIGLHFCPYIGDYTIKFKTFNEANERLNIFKEFYTEDYFNSMDIIIITKNL